MKKTAKTVGFLATIAVIVTALFAAVILYQRYESRPWTRDGQVRANIVGIAPRVEGPIIEIPVKDNQAVKQGDLLFKIDPSTYQAQLNNAIARQQEAEAAFTQATQELQRQRQLFETQVTDKRDFENAQDAFAAAKAALAAAKAEVQTAQLDLLYTTVNAPVDGFVTNMNTSPGTYVARGEQLLALVDSSSFWVAAYFKETQVPNIRLGDMAEVRLMGHATHPFQGVVHSIGWGIFLENGATVDLLPQVQQTVDWVRLPNRFPVRIHVQGAPPVPLRIGQTASISILGEPKPQPDATPQQEAEDTPHEG